MAEICLKMHTDPSFLWLNRDPIGEEGGLNLYRMVENDAVNRWDFLGLDYPMPSGYPSTPGRGIPLSEMLPQLYPGRRVPPPGPQRGMGMDGCVGLCRTCQPGNQPAPGHPDQKNPEDVPDTRCYKSKDTADEAARRCEEDGQKPFVFAKQGKWPNGEPYGPKVRPEDYIVPMGPGEFNYVTQFPNGMCGDSGGGSLAAKLGATNPRYWDDAKFNVYPEPPDKGGYEAEMWCVTCACKK